MGGGKIQYEMPPPMTTDVRIYQDFPGMIIIFFKYFFNIFFIISGFFFDIFFDFPKNKGV